MKCGSLLGWCVVACGLSTVGCDFIEKAKEQAEEAKEAAENAKKPKAGEKCEQEESVVCKDKETMLQCTDKKWETIPCRGEKGCTGTVVVSCDQTVAKVDDPCGKEENFSCTTDGKAQVKCTGGKWKEVAVCRGPKACETKFPFSKCDQSIVRAGDVCEKEGNAACSEDGKNIMECKSGKYAATDPCANGCTADGVFVKCK